jgi:hypothetical protein
MGSIYVAFPTKIPCPFLVSPFVFMSCLLIIICELPDIFPLVEVCKMYEMHISNRKRDAALTSAYAYTCQKEGGGGCAHSTNLNTFADMETYT